MMPRSRRFFVYILEFDEGNFYVGHTKDIRKELAENRNAKILSTAGRNPRLQYVELAATVRDAEVREAELKRLVETNPEQIQMMVSEFHRLMREFGFE